MRLLALLPLLAACGAGAPRGITDAQMRDGLHDLWDVMMVH